MQQASCRPAGPARRPDAASAANANNEPYLQHNLSHGLHGIETAGEITVAGLWLGLDMSQYSKRSVILDQERLGGSETFRDLRRPSPIRIRWVAEEHTRGWRRRHGGFPLVDTPNRTMLKVTVCSASLNAARDRDQ